MARRRCSDTGGAFGGADPGVSALASAGGSGLQATPVQCHCKPVALLAACLDGRDSAPMRCGDLSRHLLVDARPSARAVRACASRSLAVGRCSSASSAALAMSPGVLYRRAGGSIGMFLVCPSAEQAESRRCLLHAPNNCAASESCGEQVQSPCDSKPTFPICMGGACGSAELPASHSPPSPGLPWSHGLEEPLGTCAGTRPKRAMFGRGRASTA